MTTWTAGPCSRISASRASQPGNGTSSALRRCPAPGLPLGLQRPVAVPEPVGEHGAEGRVLGRPLVRALGVLDVLRLVPEGRTGVEERRLAGQPVGALPERRVVVQDEDPRPKEAATRSSCSRWITTSRNEMVGARELGPLPPPSTVKKTPNSVAAKRRSGSTWSWTTATPGAGPEGPRRWRSTSDPGRCSSPGRARSRRTCGCPAPRRRCSDRGGRPSCRSRTPWPGRPMLTHLDPAPVLRRRPPSPRGGRHRCPA
jgi:hypothetical protein